MSPLEVVEALTKLKEEEQNLGPWIQFKDEQEGILLSAIINRLPPLTRATYLKVLTDAWRAGPNQPNAWMLKELIGEDTYSGVYDPVSYLVKSTVITFARYRPKKDEDDKDFTWHAYVIWEAHGTPEAIKFLAEALMPAGEWEPVEAHPACSNCFKPVAKKGEE